jgi:hypothetical protein
MNTIANIVLRVAAGIAALVAVQGAKAVEACVTTSQGLQQALDVLAQSTPQALTIHVLKGVYHISNISSQVQVSVSIVGGYLDCNTRDPNLVPEDTFIDVSGGMHIYGGSDDAPVSFILDGLMLANGGIMSFYAGDEIEDQVGHVTMKRVHLANAYVRVTASSGNVVMENVLLDRLRTYAVGDPCAFRLSMTGNVYANLRFVTAGLQGSSEFCIDPYYDDNNTVDIVDSLIWKVGSNGGPVLLQGETENIGSTSLDVHVINSGFAGLDPTRFGNWTVTNQIFTTPNWVDPDNGNYHWIFPSPNNIDAGTSQIPHGSVPPVDIDGNPRPYAGSRPDPGAYEFQGASGVPSTVVTTALDNVNNDAYVSLREAIKNANLNGGGHITFNIQGGGCPQTIFLSSPLDPITAPITIDGTTQPGATVNASPDAFDANLCVALVPNGVVANALKVPSDAPDSASLTVRGVFFGGFSQSVVLAGGNNHLIAGNQFGGTVGGVTFPGSYLNAISIGANATGNLIVGGDNAVDRNVIVGANGPTANAIGIASDISGCQIVNNLIGIDADGVTPHPNSYGIHISGSGCDLRANRIGNSIYDGIWLLGDDNVAEQNFVGVAVDGSPAPNGSVSGGTPYGYGVHVSGSNNTIGVDKVNGFDGQFHANDVRFNTNGGIVVDLGTGNSVRGNIVSSNGPGADGSAMDIDLGGDGITGNLMPNPGTGPNGLQNHPELISLKFIGNPPKPGDTSVPAELDGIVYGSPGAYKVDIYFAQTGCEADGRGHAESYIASQDVTIPASATSKTFEVLATIPVYAPLHALVANQTDAAGNSSELSSCLPNDTIFRDGADY